MAELSDAEAQGLADRDSAAINFRVYPSPKGEQRNTVSEVRCADLTEWLTYIKDARRAGKTVEILDDPMTRSLGVLVAEKILYVLSLHQYKEGFSNVPPELAAFYGNTSESLKVVLATAEGRREALAGGYTGMYDYSAEDKLTVPAELEMIWEQEALAEKLPDMGDMGLERPPPQFPPGGMTPKV